MGKSIELLRQYVWLVETIREAGRITLKELKDLWEKEAVFCVRKFHRYREAIKDIYGIDIVCDRANNTYYIGNPEILKEATVSSWFFNSMAIENQLLGHEELIDRVVFEDIPGGIEYLPKIIRAMDAGIRISIDYDSIWDGFRKALVVESYFLKQHLRRWYLVGRVCDIGKIEVFALDRMLEFRMLKETFQYDKTIRPHTFFDEVVGIQLDEDYDCEKVVVRVYGKQAQYIELLPLHRSQKLMKIGKGYRDYEYNVRPEWEFIHEILRLGSSVEVLSPQWVREEIPWQADEIIKRYRRSDNTENGSE